MTKVLALNVTVPVASFRLPRAREYFETYPCPPPSTVYGMLLSLVGEVNRHKHTGAEIAIAAKHQPEISVLLRTLWRTKDRNEGRGLGNNRRPDFQEILTNLSLVVWLRKGSDTHSWSLVDRVQAAFEAPQNITRFGGLSLGESSHLVDDISIRSPVGTGQVLLRKEFGELSLPIWSDHVGSFTRWDQFTLAALDLTPTPPEEAWIEISPPSLRAASAE